MHRHTIYTSDIQHGFLTKGQVKKRTPSGGIITYTNLSKFYYRSLFINNLYRNFKMNYSDFFILRFDHLKSRP